jgi:hypothetical protein
MISIWAFLVLLAIPIIAGYDFVKLSTEWLESKTEMRPEGYEDEECEECIWV